MPTCIPTGAPTGPTTAGGIRCRNETATAPGFRKQDADYPGSPDDASRFSRRSHIVEPECRCRRAAILPVLRVHINRLDREGSGREQLLALFPLRRGLESQSPHDRIGTAVATMTADSFSEQSARAQTIRELHELIAALDRRVPQVERLGELAIARAADLLRLEALRRIEELTKLP